MHLDALDKRLSRIEQKLQPVNTDRAEVREMLEFCHSLELAQLSAIFDAVIERNPRISVNTLTTEVMSADEISLVEAIEQKAMARKAAGQGPYSGINPSPDFVPSSSYHQTVKN